MQEDVREFLEFQFAKIRRLKCSERGEVWLAQEKSTNRLVVIKFVQRTGLPYSAIKKSDFTLPAKVFYCFEDEIETIIVEEFIAGENLLERLEQKNFLTESQARKILLQMCDGLGELHAQKIIHRDIKPANLILQGEKIRLIDFDAARIFKNNQAADTKPLGTRGYAPPEQFGSGQTDPRSDIYALGKTMKILLGENCGALKKILDKCTEIDPKYRFQSVGELKIALTTAENHRGKIFLSSIVAAVIFFAYSAPLNFGENFTEKSSDSAEIPQKISAPAQIVEEFKPPEIFLPINESSPIEIPVPQKISQQNSPRKIDLPQIPAIISPPENPPIEIPAPQPITPTPQKISSGLIRTQFFFNEEPFDQFEHLHQSIKMSRADWRQSGVRLRLTNDTGEIWANPSIKYVIGQNWGDKLRDTITLPSLADGESADFVIPFNFDVSERKNTDTYIQIWLAGDEKKLDEHYWSIRFEMID